MTARAAFLRCALVAIALSASPVVHAADSGQRLSEYSLTNWTEEDGPFPFGVLAIAQDRDGYLWLGGRLGLIRFDGNNFELWHGQVPLPDERLSSIFTAHDGAMWLGFGTQGAVSVIRDGAVTTFGTADGLAGGPVSAVYEDADGSIFVCSHNGLTRYRERVWSKVGQQSGLPSESVLGVLRDSAGGLWVSTSVGVYRQGSEGEPFQRVSDLVTKGFAEDHDGTIWAPDPVTGFRVLRSRTPHAASVVPPAHAGAGRSLMLDRSGSLWVATRGAGVVRVSDGKAERLSRLDGLISEDVRQVFEDRDGTIWIGSRRGLSRLTKRSVRALTGDISKDAFVYAVTSTRDGSVWTGTADGLMRLADGREQLFGAQQGLPGQIVTALHEDRSGTLWVATTRGVARFVNNRFVPLETGDERLQFVGSMTSDRGGRLWLCDAKGVFVWHDGALTRLSRELEGRKAYNVYADSADRVWIGFWDTGVALLQNDHIRFYSAADGVPPGGVSAIHEDRAGHVWVGTERGLARFEGNRFQSFTARGLPETGYVSVVEDKAGFLWLATGVGLLRISPREFELAATNSGHRLQYTIYGADDGLNGHAGRPGTPSSAVSADGSLLFVTSVGLALVDPNTLRDRPAHGRVRIERFSADGQALDPGREIALESGISRLQIDYSVLSLAGASKSRFRYRLDGFDQAWNEAGERRQALYTNLPPGRFTFRVVTANDTGWNESGAALSFTLEPAFYQRRSFFAITALLIIAGIWGAWIVHLRHVRAQFSLILAERTRVGREIHDTLLQSLVGVALEFDDIAEQLDPDAWSLRQQVSQIRQRVEHYIREARQSIWNLRSPTLETKDLPAALQEAGELVTMHHGIDFRFRVDGRPVRLADQVEEQLLRIGQEAVSNAVRHGQPETISMGLCYDRDETSLSIEDDGRGFDVDAVERAATDHWGISNMRERAKQAGGRLALRSEPGGGSSVRVVVSGPKRLAQASTGSGRQQMNRLKRRWASWAAVAILVTASHGAAQTTTSASTTTDGGQWPFLGGSASHTRSSPLNQINAANFDKLKVAWVFRGDNFGPGLEFTARATPIYVDGVLYTVMGQRRQVVAIDAATGETKWTFREPETSRYYRSPRTDFGKGVAYAKVDGRGVIYISTPGFFLWALDARTGRPLENWGTVPVPLKDFPKSGVIDMIPDLVRDWDPWKNWKGEPYDPDYGLPRKLGEVTSSSPPIVVNGVVVVLAGHEPSYDQTRIENVPADIQGYDAKTGRHLWKFHVVPRAGEYGNDTWGNDSWKWSGNIANWAPAAADTERGLVYVVTNASTYQFYTGQRPGYNLFGGSIIALDVKTGKRKWHYQVHHSDQWNYDIPTAPMLMDLTVNGKKIPALVQNTKQGLIFALNRETGEPIWPIEERPVIQTEVPGNYTAPTQPYPTRPEPADKIVVDGITDQFIMDYTPELKRRAQEALSKFRIGGLYVPPLPYPHKNTFLNNVGCVGGLNIYHPPTADPSTNIMYVPHARSCSAPSYLVPTEGKDEERTEFAGKSAEAWRGRDRVTPTTGTTVAPWKQGGPRTGTLPLIDGLPVYKPLFQGLAAYDMNTGEKLWDVPIGKTPERMKNNPLLKGLDLSGTGGTGNSIQMVMGDLLLQTSEDLRGDAEVNEKGNPLLHARDKKTGKVLKSIELPAPGQYGMMTFMHEGKQYIIVQAGSARRNEPGQLIALALP